MLLVVNGGSSSIKFAIFKQTEQPEKVFSGQIDHIGKTTISFKTLKADSQLAETIQLDTANDYPSIINYLAKWLERQMDVEKITAIAHRIVHGMQHTAPTVITEALLASLKQIIPYDPDHLPNEINLIEVFQQYFPGTVQVACFDTAFHQTMPRVARLLPIPRRFESQGISRYGFHGLSYQYLIQALEKTAGKDVANGRVILAHLGNGASLAAVHHGQSMDTSMAFTPAAGIPMSSRSGDLDPGVAWYIMKSGNLSPDQFNQLINHESGLLGIAETSGDMADLLVRESTDFRAKEAVDLFCYEVKKKIGAYAAALGGIDTLIFSGGIGENAPGIRQRICENLDFLGIKLDARSNQENNKIISVDTGKVTIRIISTDEAWMMAQIVNKMIRDGIISLSGKTYQNE
ncbi:acetate/propionate family kinase [Chitinophaga sp. MM2321]|uniref:acetate/propionate family kinase n=1 Tax=Chitinophaga sp. MM2321 TaxID=3137178 RepID=UPI0032D57E57